MLPRCGELVVKVCLRMEVEKVADIRVGLTRLVDGMLITVDQSSIDESEWLSTSIVEESDAKCLALYSDVSQEEEEEV